MLEQLAASGTHLVCLNAWRPGDGTPPTWWNDEEGAWMRQLDAMREEERRQREQANRPSQPGENGADSHASQASTTSQANEQHEEVHHA